MIEKTKLLSVMNGLKTKSSRTDKKCSKKPQNYLINLIIISHFFLHNQQKGYSWRQKLLSRRQKYIKHSIEKETTTKNRGRREKIC